MGPRIRGGLKAVFRSRAAIVPDRRPKTRATFVRRSKAKTEGHGSFPIEGPNEGHDRSRSKVQTRVTIEGRYARAPGGAYYDRKSMIESPVRSSPLPQAFQNGEIHDWYRTVWGYSDHLVASLLDEFGAKRKSTMRVLDPFCGSGTTLVECMKRGVDSAGIDANPVSCLAARVKTNWSLKPERLLDLLDEVRAAYQAHRSNTTYSDPTYIYLEDSGMISRGWISPEPLRKALVLKRCLGALDTNNVYRQALTLLLLDTLLRTASNVKFGPELYCAKRKDNADVIGDFSARVKTMAEDLDLARHTSLGSRSRVIEGDSRNSGAMKERLGGPRFSHVICSPPYPAEHDYTRNSRLELAFLEKVSDRDSLQAIKRNMVRSHTKGIYSEDADSDNVSTDKTLNGLVRRIDRAAATKEHGFAKLYSRVTTEYFGGMKRHLESLHPILRRGATLAYVVGDQSSYLQVPVETAKILGSLAEQVGYDLVEIRHWRDRSSRSRAKTIVENILILRKSF